MKRVYVCLFGILFGLSAAWAETSSGNTVSSGNTTSSGNITDSSNSIGSTTSSSNIVSTTSSSSTTINVTDPSASTNPTPVTTNIDDIMRTAKIASSGSFKIAHYRGAYYVQWAYNEYPVRLVRGDLDTRLLIFKETVLFEGKNSTYYIDTIGNDDTHYYSLYFNGGKLKLDINKTGFYDLVTHNMTEINHDENTMQREVAVAQFGKAAILRWYSLYDAYYINLNYSGTAWADYNVENRDNDSSWNYYIIDNITNLSDLSVYELTSNMEKRFVFSVAFAVKTNPNSYDNTLELVGGSSQDIFINNGELTTIAGDVINNSNDARKGMFIEGGTSGSGGAGGGCFLNN